MDLSLAIEEELGDFRPEPVPLVQVIRTADPLAVPSGSCPKCLAVRSEAAESCPGCGLEYGRFHASLVEPTDPLVQSFAWLQAGAAELEEHLKLLARAELLGELPQVVRLYRIWLVREPGNAVARQAVQEAVKIASARLAAGPAAPTSTRARNLIMFLVVVMFLATVTIKTVSALH